MHSALARCRDQFPALERTVNGRPAVYLDGPGGTQVPQCVIDAIAHYLAHTNANHGGLFATSLESDAVVERASRAVADFLGAPDPATIVFGQNMTSLTMAMSRSLARTWRPGDEIVVTRLDHDANVSPWVLAARDAGATVRFAGINSRDCTLDVDDLRRHLSPRTRLVAVGCASNASGSLNPVREICAWAREVGALTYLDAVHFAPHARIDVQAIGCDFLACSAYKFFGPHIGILWGRRQLLADLHPYKVRPAPDSLPDRWMTGTQSFEAIAGTEAAIEYLARLGRDAAQDPNLTRTAALDHAFELVQSYERELVGRLLAALAELEHIQVWGITDPRQLDQRLPTVSITHRTRPTTQFAQRLADRGLFVWNGNYYALELTESLGLEPEGMVRIGLVHYNTREEVDRLVGEIAASG